ncbi:Transcription elongation factor S-II [Daldinia childiae]|uniref:Transcription elongation factor S-II n=1 Tax=Daldinia childiae TaxID=326645 RepID=UPI0014464C7B|nr:Transcription elongation factor S-II [Daldinia childiae]KAF3057076.1 Transcription elongation factor S-II [Daldinia childiae]
MDQRELDARVKALHKAAQSNEPASAIISIIESLRSASPTEEMLRTTKAGIVVGKLRGNANKDIAKIATEVVAKWKKGIELEKKSKGLHSAKAPKGSVSPASKAASPAPKPLAGNKKAYEGDLEKRNYKTDKVDINRTGSQVRDNCIGLLYNGLAYRSRESEDSVITRAAEVEQAAFKAYKGETKEYKEKIRSLFQNLKVKTNAELGRNVMSGAIAAERFVVMTSKELMSAQQRKADAELELENMKKAQVPMVEKSISDSLECGNCKKKMVSYTQAQTRSADEPMTTFCECMNCGKRWKFS